ncbi:MAG: hypothetical protein NC918_00105 [Candidatus Omnitrophica bacterium]|nr:hypothetical protein [Candidatus Omnitrophota bacterium]
MSLTLNPDGTAHASEEFLLFINDSYSIKVYQDSFVLNDLASWSERTKINELRTHISRAYVDLVNLRVRPSPVFNCNNIANTCFGKISIDYDVRPIANNRDGILKITQYKPRAKLYSLLTNSFSFQVSKTDDIILPYGYSLKISVPENANKVSFSVMPNNIEQNPLLFRFDPSTSENYYLGKEKVFIWSSQTLSKFSFSYQIEQKPEEEIKDFFLSLQLRFSAFFFKLLHPPYLLSTLSIVLGLFWLNSVKNMQKK